MKFRRVILQAPRCVVVDAKTIGQLAERNWSKKGSYEKTEIIEKDRCKERAQTKEDLTLKSKINKATPQQKAKYIETGII